MGVGPRQNGISVSTATEKAIQSQTTQSHMADQLAVNFGANFVWTYRGQEKTRISNRDG